MTHALSHSNRKRMSTDLIPFKTVRDDANLSWACEVCTLGKYADCTINNCMGKVPSGMCRVAYELGVGKLKTMAAASRRD